MKLFMIDIESTGVDQNNDDIIEIGIVHMIKRPDGFYLPHNEIYHRVLYTDKKPTSPFAIKHMKDLYEKANTATSYSPREIRQQVVDYLKSCGGTGSKDVQFCGWNSSTFDTPFMVKKRYLVPSGYDKEDNLVGDFHYRPYEISGAIELASDVTGYSRKTVLSMAEEIRKPKIDMPKGKDHDAVYDCYSQINMLNGLIAVMRKH